MKTDNVTLNRSSNEEGKKARHSEQTGLQGAEVWSQLAATCMYIYHSHVLEQLVPVSFNAAEEVILSTFSSAEEHSIGRWTCVAGVF